MKTTMLRQRLFAFVAIALFAELSCASLFLPFLEALNHHQDSLSNIDSNTTRAQEAEDADLKKRQVVAAGCPNGYSNCGSLGASGLCCANNAVCTPDNQGYVACCPVGAVCTGTITGVITEGTIPPGVVSTRTTNLLTGTTTVSTTTSFSSATPNNGLIIASGSVSTDSDGFIIAGGATLATPASAHRGAQAPWIAEAIVAACEFLRLL